MPHNAVHCNQIAFQSKADHPRRQQDTQTFEGGDTLPCLTLAHMQ